MTQHNDKTLMLLYSAGELEHFQSLFAGWKDPVYRYLYHMIREDAETVYQSTWLKFIERRAEFNENTNFKGWLFGIAHTQLIEHLADRGLESIMDAQEKAAEASSQNLHELYFRSRFEQGLMGAISTLPGMHKEVFLLSEEGLALEEIAEAIFVDTTVAKSRNRHASEILGKTLSAWGLGSMDNISDTWKTIREVMRNDVLDDQIVATSKLPDWPPKLVNLDELNPPEQVAEVKKPTSIWNRVKPAYAVIGLVMAISIGTVFFLSFVPDKVAHVASATAIKTKPLAQKPPIQAIEIAPIVESVPPIVLDENAGQPFKKVAFKKPHKTFVSEENILDAKALEELEAHELALAAASAEIAPEPAPPPPPKLVWVQPPDNSYWSDSNPIKSAPYFTGKNR